MVIYKTKYNEYREINEVGERLITKIDGNEEFHLLGSFDPERIDLKAYKDRVYLNGKQAMLEQVIEVIDKNVIVRNRLVLQKTRYVGDISCEELRITSPVEEIRK